jgi:hypothetical protein
MITMDVKIGRVEGLASKRDVCGGKPLIKLPSSSLLTVVMYKRNKIIQINKHIEIVGWFFLADISKNNDLISLKYLRRKKKCILH